MLAILGRRAGAMLYRRVFCEALQVNHSHLACHVLPSLQFKI